MEYRKLGRMSYTRDSSLRRHHFGPVEPLYYDEVGMFDRKFLAYFAVTLFAVVSVLYAVI